MIVICEECGKKYRVDSTKIKGKTASFKCHICSHVIMAYKTRVPPAQLDSKVEAGSPKTDDNQPVAADYNTIGIAPSADKTKTATRHQRQAGGVSLRTKMFLVFLFIPLIIIAGGSFFYLWHLETTSRLLVRETSKIATQLAENKIDDIAVANALIQTRAKALTDNARSATLVMLGAKFLLIILIVSTYVLRLTGKIKSLAEITDRISAGEFEIEIDTKSRDEIGDLSNAIARIQETVQLSIERLQARRGQSKPIFPTG